VFTNVVKHARATSCLVTVGYGESDLSIEITDDGVAAGASRLSATDGSPDGYGGPGAVR